MFDLHAHLVFVTRCRGRIFSGRHLQTLERLFRKVCEDFEAELVGFEGGSDHVRLAVRYPPKVALARLVNSLKGASSRKLKQHHPELIRSAYLKNALWSPSYYAGSLAEPPREAIRRYIEQQR